VKYLTCVLPPVLAAPLEELKITLQNKGVSLNGRQVVGRDSIALASVTYLLSLPADDQEKIVMAGIEIMRKHREADSVETSTKGL
jgi:hypothetical protein